MKKLIVVLSFLFVGPLVYVASGGDTGFGTDPFTATGEFLHTDGNTMNNAINDNDSRLDTVEALTGPVFSDGDGTYTDMSAISSTELGLLEGKTDLASADGEIYTGAHNFGDATSVEIPNGTDPDVTVVGQVSNDTDGANVIFDGISDQIIRVYTTEVITGVTQLAAAGAIAHYDLNFSTSGAETTWQPWRNKSGMDAYIIRIGIRTDDNGLVVEVDEYTGFGNITILNEVEPAITCSTAGTGIYTNGASGIEYDDINHQKIEAGHGLSFDFDGAATGTIELSVVYDADVN